MSDAECCLLTGCRSHERLCVGHTGNGCGPVRVWLHIILGVQSSATYDRKLLVLAVRL
jgi:hypothetical protein